MVTLRGQRQKGEGREEGERGEGTGEGEREQGTGDHYKSEPILIYISNPRVHPN